MSLTIFCFNSLTKDPKRKESRNTSLGRSFRVKDPSSFVTLSETGK